MAFLNLHLLWGLLGIAIPIIIHLMNRRTPKPVVWGAMIFLRDSLTHRRRKILLEEILLLCLRCLLALVLGMMMARPFLNSGALGPGLIILPLMAMAVGLLAASFLLAPRGRLRPTLRFLALFLLGLGAAGLLWEERLQNRLAGTRGSRDIALVIDASDSMTLSSDGVSNFSRAVSEAIRVVEAAPSGSGFSLVVGGDMPHARISSPTRDREAVLLALGELEPGTGRFRAADSLAVATLTLARGRNPAKQTVVFSNGLREAWDLSPNHSSWIAVRDSRDLLPGYPSMIFRRFDHPPSVRNLGIESANLSRGVLTADRPVLLEITLRNSGSETLTPGALLLEAGGETFSNREIGQLAAGASATARFSLRFPEPGIHELTLRLETSDDLPLDDRLSLVAQVAPPLRVLLLDDSGSTRFFERASAHTALALAPEAETKTGSAPARNVSAFRPVLRGVEDDLGPETLSAFDLVILSDLSRLPAQLAGDLARFVSQGGALLATLGPSANPTFYNDWTWDGQPVLPLRLAGRRSLRMDADAEARPSPFRLAGDTLLPTGPRDLWVAGMRLDAVGVFSHWQLDPHPSGTDGAPRVELALEDGQAVLASHALGEGRVRILAFALDPRDSTLPITGAFIPLLRSLLHDLGSAAAQDLNLAMRPGATLRFPLQPGADPSLSSRENFFSISRNPGEEPELLFMPHPSLLPGRHELHPPSEVRRHLAHFPGDGPIPFTLRRGGVTDLHSTLGEAELTLLRRFTPFQEADSLSALLHALEGGRIGREIWRFLAWAAVALLVLETLASRWIAKRRRIGDASETPFGEIQPNRADMFKGLQPSPPKGEPL